MCPPYFGHENRIEISYFLETSLHFWNENQLDYYFLRKNKQQQNITIQTDCKTEPGERIRLVLF